MHVHGGGEVAATTERYTGYCIQHAFRAGPEARLGSPPRRPLVTDRNAERFERGFLGIVEGFFVIGEGKIQENDQRALTNGLGNATLWAAGLFGLAELGYAYGEHRGSHGGDHGQG